MNTLARNKKLVEALGMLLVLGAWMLDWGSIQHWSQLENSLRDSLSSIQNGYNASHTVAVIQLEAAVTRATPGATLPESSTDDYALAWQSPEVRAAWLRRVASTIQMMRNISQVLRETQARELIGTAGSLRNLNDKLDRVATDARAALSSSRGRAASQIEPQLNELSTMTVAAANDLIVTVQSTSEWRSRAYLFVFLIGSIVLLFGRCLDWWQERQLPSS